MFAEKFTDKQFEENHSFSRNPFKRIDRSCCRSIGGVGSLVEFSTDSLSQQRQRFFSPHGPSVGRPTLETDSSHLSECEVIAEVQDQFKSPSEMAFSQGDQSITSPATIRIYRRVAQMEW